MSVSAGYDRLVPLVFLYAGKAGDDDGLLPLALLQKFCVDYELYTDAQKFLADVESRNPDICLVYMEATNLQKVQSMVEAIRRFKYMDVPVVVFTNGAPGAQAELLRDAGADKVQALPVTEAALAGSMGPYLTTSAIKKVVKEHGISLERPPRKLAVVASAPPAAVTAAIPAAKPAAAPAPQAWVHDDGPAEVPAEAPPPAEQTAEKKEPSVSPIVDWLFSTMIPTLESMEDWLESLDNAEAQVSFYQQKLMPFKEDFVRMIKAMRRMDTSEPDFTQCLRLYGVSSLRKLVVAQRLLEVTGGKPLRWDPTSGRPTVDPRTVIPCAVALVEHYDEASAYRTIAFNAGLVLDVLLHASSFAAERKPLIKSQIEASLKDIMRRTDEGIKRGKAMKNLAFGKHILTTLTLREAGRIAMAIFFKDYQAQRVRFEKKKTPLPLQQIAETKLYGISHNVIGALLCQNTPGFYEIHKAVLFCNFPPLIKGMKGEEDSFTLAELCAGL